MNSSDFRAKAREILNGKWGKAALITLSFFVISLVTIYIIGRTKESISAFLSIVYYIISIPLSFGLFKSFVNLYKGNNVQPFDFITLGFSNFTKSWGLAIRMILKLILPIILYFISFIMIGAGSIVTFFALFDSSLSKGIIPVKLYPIIAILGFILFFVSIIWLFLKALYYQLSFIIAADDETISSKDAVEKSRELMTGNRLKLFCLQLSFIGWAFLAGLTFGIGLLWVLPYMQVAIIVFYFHLKGDNLNNTITEVIDETTHTEN